MKLKSLMCVAMFFLVIQGNAASQETQALDNGVQQKEEAWECHGLGCRFARPISETNPYGLDFGWRDPISSGVPSRALAMAKAQIHFAGDKCQKLSKRKQNILAETYLGLYGFDINPGYLRLFNEGVDRFKMTYEDAWLTLDDGQRDAFCEAYYADAKVNIHKYKAHPAQVYLHYLAPLSDEGEQDFEKTMKRAEKVKWLAVFGQVLSLAAQVSAGHDAIQEGNSALAEGKSGNIGAMNSQMAQSNLLFRDSAHFANVGQYFGTVSTATNAGAAVQNTDSQSEDGQFNLDCQAVMHFSKWDAPSDTEIWKTYQSFSTGCDAVNRLRAE